MSTNHPFNIIQEGIRTFESMMPRCSAATEFACHCFPTPVVLLRDAVPVFLTHSTGLVMTGTASRSVNGRGPRKEVGRPDPLHLVTLRA